MSKLPLFIITGANGAGKSTLSSNLLLQDFQYLKVFDGDKIYLEKFRELLAKKLTEKESRNIAGEFVSNLFDEEVEKAIALQNPFAYEAHLFTTESYQIPDYFKRNGYEIHLNFLGLDSIQQSIERVQHRALMGGHNVTIAEIAVRFDGNMYFLNQNFESIDYIKVFDANDFENLQLIIAIEKGEIIYSKRSLPKWFIKGFPRIIQKIR